MKAKLLLLFAIFLCSTISYSQPGFLDNTFDFDGKVTTAIGSLGDGGYEIAIQNDGKIVVSGYSWNGSDNDFALVRYNSDGSLDNSFGIGGKDTTDIGINDYGNSLAIQSDGKIVVAGSSETSSFYYDFALVRYNSNGSLDSTFDFDGKVTTSFGTSGDYGYSIAIQSDGKIVVAGRSDFGTDDFALARYNTDGSLDNTFGVSGKVNTDIGGNTDVVHSVAIQSNGKIVVAGNSWNGSDHDFALARYNTDGSLDTAFGSSGKVITVIGNASDVGNSVAIQSDGKILVAGYKSNTSDYDFALVRYNSNGSLDTTFGIGGKVTTDFGSSSDDNAESMVIQSDGKIVLGGSYSSNISDYDFGLARYNSNGNLDSTFGSFGKVTTNFGGAGDFAYSVALQTDGKIVLAGESNTGSSMDFAVARYNNSILIGINNLVEHEIKLKLFPNPFSTHTVLQTDNILHNATLTVDNCLGQTVAQIKNISGHTITFNRDNLASGLYFVRLTEENKIITVDKFVIIDK